MSGLDEGSGGRGVVGGCGFIFREVCKSGVAFDPTGTSCDSHVIAVGGACGAESRGGGK